MSTTTASAYFSDSLILTSSESARLVQLSSPSYTTLIYRGSRDGLNRTSWHSKCDNVTNTVTIILNNLNYVLGGYTSIGFSTVSSSRYLNDTSAYIFSLRQGANATNGFKFTIFVSAHALYLSASARQALCSYVGSYYCDIACGLDNSFYFSDFGASYNLPAGYNWSYSAARSYLAGSYSSRTTSEMEVCKIY